MGLQVGYDYRPAPPTTIPAKDSKNDRLEFILFPTLIILPIIPFVKQNCIRLSASQGNGTARPRDSDRGFYGPWY